MDDVDRKIVSQLQANGRTSLEELSRITGFTSMGTKKRLQKLLANGTIKVSAVVNLAQLKLLPAIVMLEMENAEAMQNLLNRFRNCPRVVNILKAIGGFNLIAFVVAENRDTLESISMEKCSLRSSQGIRRSEFYPIGDDYLSPFFPVRENLTGLNKSIAPCGVDCKSCPRYIDGKCVGCPATKYYRGSL
ncbi:MAG: Lrp/AsnC family transcriptional regulator [Candidatus Bathyarchaeia archaeon]